MSEFDDTESSSGARGWVILLLTVLLAGGGFAWWKFGSHSTATPRTERITMVSLPPPPPKPLPTPPPIQPPEQKIVDNKPRMDDAKPEAPKPEPIKPPDEPPSMGSNIKGEGNDGFNLSGSGNGGRVGIGGRGTGGGNGYAAYAGQLQGRLAEALRQDPRTRAATFNLKLKVWLDESGRITRAEPSGSGSPAQAITGLQLSRPPAGMPMPIALRLVASRPR